MFLSLFTKRGASLPFSAYFGASLPLFSLCAAGVYYFIGRGWSSLLCLGLGIAGVFCLFHLFRTRTLFVSRCLAGIILIPAAWALVASGGLWGIGTLWILLYPVMFVSGLGLYLGLAYTVVLYIGVLAVFWIPLTVGGAVAYDGITQFQYAVILLCVAFFSCLMEFLRFRTQTELMDLARRMEVSALQDLLTGLGNRRDFYGRYEQEKARLARKGTVLSLCMCDIDAFRQFNEDYGSECGDIALKYVAQTLQTALRKQDTVFYWGGGTFLVMLPEMNVDGTRIVAERLRYAVESQPLVYEGRLFGLTLSFGVHECDFAVPVDQNVLAADRKLYQAKNLGRNCVFG